jgi:FtsP/CotA-like multicopper oxidase with cupredoxin domain
MKNFTRRQVLMAGGLAGMGLAGLLSTGCGSDSDTGFVQTTSVPLAPEFDFPQPKFVASVDGFLDTEMTIDFAENFIDDFRLFTRTYEGTIPGPTLRLGQGDLLRVRQINQLPPNEPEQAGFTHNRPHNLNTFNFHSHGWHVDPNGLSDNTFAKFEPGTTNSTVIQLPTDHHEGTFWYHPHTHGSAAEQIAGGMAGFLIVEGPTDLVPEIAAAREVLMMIQNIRVDDNGQVPEFDSSAALRDSDQSFFLVNGKQTPTLRMRPGEVQRWRICHGSIRELLDLQLDGHSLHQIAQDGLTFSAPTDRERILIAPGNRVDVMVRAGAPGTYVLRSIDDGFPAPTGQVAVDLVTVVVEGEPLVMDLPTQLPGTPSLQPITDAEIAASTAGPNGNGKRVIAFVVSQGAAGFNGDPNFETAFRMAGTGETPPTTVPAGYDPNAYADFTQQPAVCVIPDILPPDSDPTWGLFNPNVINHTLEIGTVEEWTICGTDHPFHMHINPFQLVAINGVRLDPPIWADTVTPAGRTLTIRFRPTEFTGDAVVHCHVLDHEDTGMMQKIRVKK